METRVSNKEKLYSAKPLTEKQKEKAALKQQSKAASRQARACAKVAKAAAKNTAVKQKLVVCGLESDEDEQSMRLEISTEQEEFVTVGEMGCDPMETTVPLIDPIDPLTHVDSKLVPEAEPSSSPITVNNPFSILRNAGKYRRIHKSVSTFGELDTVIRTKWPKTSVTHSDHIGCTVCGNKGDHKMRSIRRKCACNVPHCNLIFKINKVNK